MGFLLPGPNYQRDGDSKFRILEKNVHGSASYEILKELIGDNDLCLLSEVTTNGEESLNAIEEYTTITSTISSTKIRGSAIIIKKRNPNYKLDQTNVLELTGEAKSRVASCTIIIKEKKYLIVSIYAPTSKDHYMTFLKQVKESIEQYLTQHGVDSIIGGDLNVCFKPHVESFFLNHSPEIDHKADKMFGELCLKSRCCDVKGFLSPKFITVSNHNYLNCRQLDYVFLPKFWQSGITYYHQFYDGLGTHETINIVVDLDFIGTAVDSRASPEFPLFGKVAFEPETKLNYCFCTTNRYSTTLVQPENLISNYFQADPAQVKYHLEELINNGTADACSLQQAAKILDIFNGNKNDDPDEMAIDDIEYIDNSSGITVESREEEDVESREEEDDLGVAVVNVKVGKVDHSKVRNRVHPYKVEKNKLKFQKYTGQIIELKEKIVKKLKQLTFKFVCPDDDCKYSTNNSHNLECHKETHYPEITECPICKNLYIGPLHLKRRMSSVCKNTNEYKCGYENCTKSYRAKSGLTSHIDIIHKKIKKHVCSKCDLKFYAKKDLERHEVLHDDDTSVNCYWDGCEMTFNTEKAMKEHRKYEHLSISYPCHICNKIYKYESALNNHLTATPEKTGKCTKNGCTLMFENKNSLKHHIHKDHHGKQLYKCEKCGKELLPMSRNYHERISCKGK